MGRTTANPRGCTCLRSALAACQSKKCTNKVSYLRGCTCLKCTNKAKKCTNKTNYKCITNKLNLTAWLVHLRQVHPLTNNKPHPLTNKNAKD